jgi:hypothetical protein
MAESTKTKKPTPKFPSLGDIVKINMLRQMEKYIQGHLKAHIVRSHENMLRKKNGEPQIKEEAPTNVMGASSSTPMTGNVDTFDPLLFSKLLKRKAANSKKPLK